MGKKHLQFVCNAKITLWPPLNNREKNSISADEMVTTEHRPSCLKNVNDSNVMLRVNISMEFFKA